MKITFLGTGTSQGVPVIACKCPVCHSCEAKDKRLRSSIMIEADEKVYIIDTGPDFRQQLLRENVNHLDAILFTHGHKDHIAGLDDVRAFNYSQKKPMDIYAEKIVHHALKQEFAYAFTEKKYPGVPEMILHEINESAFFINNQHIQPIRVMHLHLPVLGFRFGDFCYITDANYISSEEITKLSGIGVLVINALRKKKHLSHFNLNEALEIIDLVKPQIAYLTHISHLMGFHQQIQNILPSNVHLAWDGLKLEIP